MILLTWNRDHGDTSWPDYPQAVRACRSANPDLVWSGSWSVGRYKNITEGQDVYMLAQGRRHPRGLLAHGFTLSTPYPDEHWNKPGHTTNYVDIMLTEALPMNEILPLDVLTKAVPGILWRNGVRGSGFPVPAHSQAALARVWASAHASTFPHGHPMHHAHNR